MLGIEPGTATCKASTLPRIVALVLMKIFMLKSTVDFIYFKPDIFNHWPAGVKVENSGYQVVTNDDIWISMQSCAILRYKNVEEYFFKYHT